MLRPAILKNGLHNIDLIMCTENGIELLLRWGLLKSLYSLSGVIDIVRWKLCQWNEGKSHKKRSTFNDIYQRNGADRIVSLIGREQEILHYVSTDGLLAFYIYEKSSIYIHLHLSIYGTVMNICWVRHTVQSGFHQPESDQHIPWTDRSTENQAYRQRE